VSAAERLHVDQNALREFCRRWRVVAMYAFGSVLTDRFAPESDVDVLVEFATDAPWGLRDLVRMETELARLLGRKVDLVERDALERSPNYIRRREVLRNLEPLHVEG